MKILKLLSIVIFFVGCATKQPIKSTSKIILIKTPTMKFYDSGFVNIYPNYVDLKILNMGNIVLNLKVYPDQVCQNSFKCISSTEFNKEFLNQSYNKEFLYELLHKKIIYHKDKKNHILIKVR